MPDNERKPNLVKRAGRAADRLLNRIALLQAVVGGAGIGEAVLTEANPQNPLVKTLEHVPLNVPGLVKVLSEAGVPPQEILLGVSLLTGLSAIVFIDGTRRYFRNQRH